MAIHYKEEQVTPRMATALLAKNPTNRIIRHTHVLNLAKEMSDGRWEKSPQTIAVATDGTLLDGQHRLMAVVASGVTITACIAYNVEKDVGKVMDIGITRSHYDRLHLVNEQYENKLICTIINGYIRCSKGRAGIPASEIEDEFLTNTSHWLWAAKVFKTKRKGLSVSTIQAALVSYHMAFSAQAEAFTQGFLEGTELTAESPIKALREALLGDRVDTKIAEGYWKTINACKYHQENRPLHYLVAATADFQGNRPERAIQAHSRSRVKGNATRRAQMPAPPR